MEMVGLIRDKRCFLCRKITQKGNFFHHDYKTLKVAAARGCPICHFLHTSIEKPSEEEMTRGGGDRKLEMSCLGQRLVVVDCSSKPRVFEFFRVRDGILALGDEVVYRNIHDNPTSEACFRLAQEWMTMCDTNHPQCQSNADLPIWPTRLIDVSGLNPRLVESPGDGYSYVTLSYCWGTGPVELEPSESGAYVQNAQYGTDEDSGTTYIVTTTRATLGSRYHGISISRLPKTVQDAISVTRRFNVKYLWVDSLCIIQDSTEDWANEASRMGDYYAASLLTLSALDSGDARSRMMLPRKHTTSVHIEGNLFLRSARRAWREVFKEAPLSHRAWALQERLLARRILHYGKDELFWECLTCSSRESITGYHFLNQTSSLPGDEDFKRSFFQLSQRNCIEVLKDWYRIVTHYSGLSLTRSTDKLPALSGLASKFAKQLEVFEQEGRESDVYIAGLWVGDLHYGLFWFRDGFSRSEKSTAYQAPSWSWASKNGPVAFMIDIDDADREYSTFDASAYFQMWPVKDLFGAIIRGSLKIFALVKTVYCQGSRNRNTELYGDAEFDLIVDIYDADREKIGTGYLDSLDDANTSLSPHSCTALWISKWTVTANDGQKRPVVYFLLVQPATHLTGSNDFVIWKRVGVGHTQDLLTKEVLSEGAFYHCESQTIILE